MQAAPESNANARHVELVLESVDGLPSLSQTATRLLALGSADEVDIEEVVSLIESDPGMTARILGLCRRADRGTSRRITSVRRAVVMLGFEAVRLAALSVSVYELVQDQAAEREAPELDASRIGHAVDSAALWKHAVAVACCAEQLAERHPRLGVKAEEAFVAGLLHDLGRLVLGLVLPRSAQRVYQLAERRGEESAPIERRIIGLDHHTVGRRIAARWGLPRALQDVMWWHSQPLEALPDEPHRPLIAAVTIAKAFCREQHLGGSGDFGSPASSRALLQEADLPADACTRMQSALVRGVVDRCRALRLDDQTDVELMLESVSAANRRLAMVHTQARQHAESGRGRSAVMEAIAALPAGSRRVIGDAVELVGTSAAGVLGGGFFAMVTRRGWGEPWRTHTMDEQGNVCGTALGEAGRPEEAPPLRRRGEAVLPGAELARLRADPWLAEACGMCGPPATALAAVLIDPAETDDGAAAVLLHNHADACAGLDDAALRTLAGVWASVIASAAAVERAERDAERAGELARELAETRDALAERESLARLGEMTSGAAHEMNTPLAVARGRAELLAQRLDPGTPEHDDARAAAEAAAEAAEIIRSLHEIASPRRPAPTPCAAREIVRDAEAIARGRMVGGPGVELRAEGEATLIADREHAATAVAEVLANAFEACPRGPIDVEVQSDALDGRIRLYVRDGGPGFSDRSVRHAFDPFFSEKDAGRRRGLGLSRARRLVELCGGLMRIAQSGPDAGGCVVIDLPAAHADHGAVAEPAPLAAS